MISQAIFNEYVRKEAYMSQMLNLFSECSGFFLSVCGYGEKVQSSL